MDGDWWNITSTAGRYTVQADSETAAEAQVIGDLLPGEILLDGMNDGPYQSAAEAEAA